MKFCCNKMKLLHHAPSEFGLNFRIFKLSDEFIEKSAQRNLAVKDDEIYNYLITEGYIDKLDNNVKKLFIDYCPFCGTELKNVYSKLKFINEHKHVW